MIRPELTNAGKITSGILVSAVLLVWVIGGSNLERGVDDAVPPAPRMTAAGLSVLPPAAVVDPLPWIDVPPLRPVPAPEPG